MSGAIYTRKFVWAPLLILAVPFIFFMGYKYVSRNFSSLPYFQENGNGKDKMSSISPFSFTDQNGITISDQEIRNKISVINLFFSGCATICPPMLANETFIVKEFSENTDVEFLSITVDPESDNVERLNTFSRSYISGGDNWHFLTGDKKTIYGFARKGLKIIATDGDGGPTDFIHSDLIVLIDRKGNVRGYYKGTDRKRIEELKEDIYKLISEKI